MRESYEQELKLQINFLDAEMLYLYNQMVTAKKSDDLKTYASLIRVYLPMQKSYLKMCAELEGITGENETDPLLSFADSAPGAV